MISEPPLVTKEETPEVLQYIGRSATKAAPLEVCTVIEMELAELLVPAVKTFWTRAVTSTV